MNLRNRLAKQWILMAALLVAGPTAALADSFDMWEVRRDDIRRRSKVGGLTPQEEADLLNDAWKDYILQQNAVAVDMVGQVMVADVYPVTDHDDGTTVNLTFSYISTADRAPVEPEEDEMVPDAVIYMVNTDPDAPNGNDYVPIGMSTDAASRFALTYTLQGFEDDVVATPLRAGQPIIIPGVEGQNVARGVVTNIPLVPEPASSILLGLGGLPLLRRMRR